MARTVGAAAVRDKNYGAVSYLAPKAVPDILGYEADERHCRTSGDSGCDQVFGRISRIVSPVYYSPQDQHAFIYIYTPVALENPATQAKTVVGFTRGTLRIDYFWGIVGKENGANGADSYAFITDNDGIRIASSKQDELSRQSSHSARPAIRDR